MLPFEPRSLRGDHVELAPLGREHATDLLQAGADAEIWRYKPIPPPRTLEDTYRWIDAALAEAAAGLQAPFAILAGGRAVGSTRYLDLRPPDRALEIGWTWIGRPWQRTAINTECKYLLLRHAFEDLGAIRVQLKTDARNLQSQRAIERIGAVREGVLRRHRVLWDGFVRDTVFYSVIDSEWPAVKARLEELLRPRS